MPNLAHVPRAKPRHAPKAASSPSAPDIATGTRLLADAMTSFLASPSKKFQSGSLQMRTFVNAYSSLMQAVPKENLLDMLQQMTQEVESMVAPELAEQPLEIASEGVVQAGPAAVTTEEFMADLRRQEKELRLADIATKRLIPGAEMKERLGVTSQALSAALKARRLFVMQGPSGEYFYPSFFADPKYDRPVLEKICKVLGDMPGGSKWDFFTSKKISLGNRNPLDALLKGKLDQVMTAAAGFAEL